MNLKIVVAIGLLVLSMLAAGCGGEGPTGCSTGVYYDMLQLHIEDSEGRTVEAFTGTIAFGDRMLEVECPGSSEDAATLGSGRAYQCSNGDLLMYVTPEETIEVELQATYEPSLVYDGDVSLDIITRYPGGGEECGEQYTAEKTVTLAADSN